VNIVGRGFARDAFIQALSAEAFVRAMLDFERALAAAETEAGIVPPDAARVIASVCADLRLAPDALAAEAKRSGSLAVPLVRALTEQVARVDGRAAAFVHYGSTSQDVLDTALVLCLKPCLTDADGVLDAAAGRLAAHARRHAGAVMLGRTLMQPATPITAGLKIARWAAALHRCRLRLAEARERALCIQLGGAVGTLDAIGGKRAMVRNGLAMRLHLHEARAWHDYRDELLRLMTELVLVTTTIGKIARDVALKRHRVRDPEAVQDREQQQRVFGALAERFSFFNQKMCLLRRGLGFRRGEPLDVPEWGYERDLKLDLLTTQGGRHGQGRSLGKRTGQLLNCFNQGRARQRTLSRSAPEASGLLGQTGLGAVAR